MNHSVFVPLLSLSLEGLLSDVSSKIHVDLLVEKESRIQQTPVPSLVALSPVGTSGDESKK